MAIVYVWFPLRPNGSISDAERMGLLTGLRLAGGSWNLVSRSSDANYSQVSRSSDANYNQVSRPSDDGWNQVNRSA
jgi:hypothetical protein